jgi:putative ABC transport system ATP-binding protein
VGVDVEVRDLSKGYQAAAASRTVALDGVILQIPAGAVVAVMGPSGSGKSTLLHIVGAMDRADGGEVRVGTLVVTGLSEREQAVYRRTIGFVFQGFHLLPALTAIDNVVAPVLPRSTDFDKTERAADLLRAVGLGGKERSLPSRLSGGEQQRVAIARALINDPGLLLADEPTGNLDSANSAEIMRLLLDLRSARGMTVIVATHDPLIATRCDRIVRLQDGKVVEDLEVSHSGNLDALLGRITGLEPGA